MQAHALLPAARPFEHRRIAGPCQVQQGLAVLCEDVHLLCEHALMSSSSQEGCAIMSNETFTQQSIITCRHVSPRVGSPQERQKS